MDRLTSDRTKNMRAMHAQLNKLNLMDIKPSLMLTFSGGRTESARELTDAEVKAGIVYLSKRTREYFIKPGDKMRKRIISMAHELGWRKAGKIDMQAVNNWCMNKGKFHKPINEHSVKELPELVSQFEMMYQKELLKNG